jgi:hypothetical protein
MAKCDYCCTFYRGGAIKDGDLRFCSGHCRDRGQMLKSALACVPEEVIEDQIASVHAGPCPDCNQRKRVDYYDSYWVWSAFILTRWGTKTHISCQECARKRQKDDLMSCVALGWWGVPAGLIVTPLQIWANIRAMRDLGSEGPSKRLKHSIKMQIARHLMSRQQYS